ncbi:hypothetical protein F4802DRAFT_18678 [Xylaria palmicola]|nr:hypothetical protein F4802DRAFT_18678 [Xylaria palmicola]
MRDLLTWLIYASSAVALTDAAALQRTGRGDMIRARSAEDTVERGQDKAILSGLLRVMSAQAIHGLVRDGAPVRLAARQASPMNDTTTPGATTSSEPTVTPTPTTTTPDESSTTSPDVTPTESTPAPTSTPPDTSSSPAPTSSASSPAPTTTPPVESTSSPAPTSETTTSASESPSSESSSEADSPTTPSLTTSRRPTTTTPRPTPTSKTTTFTSTLPDGVVTTVTEVAVVTPGVDGEGEDGTPTESAVGNLQTGNAAPCGARVPGFGEILAGLLVGGFVLA